MIVGTDDPREIADFFLNRGVGNVAVKLGSRGAYFKNAETAFFAKPYAGLRIVEKMCIRDRPESRKIEEPLGTSCAAS